MYLLEVYLESEVVLRATFRDTCEALFSGENVYLNGIKGIKFSEFVSLAEKEEQLKFVVTSADRKSSHIQYGRFTQVNLTHKGEKVFGALISICLGREMSSSELTESQKATNAETFKHIERVRNLLNGAAVELFRRGELHDQSKLKSPEVDIFTEFTPKLRGMTYGSDEYKRCLEQMKPALVHHYAHNRHHPEYHKYRECDGCFKEYPLDSLEEQCGVCGYTLSVKDAGVGGMTLIDLLEMFLDWKAAGERHDDGCIFRSIRENKERFGLSDQLTRILFNTAEEMFGHDGGVPDGKPLV